VIISHQVRSELPIESASSAQSNARCALARCGGHVVPCFFPLLASAEENSEAGMITVRTRDQVIVLLLIFAVQLLGIGLARTTLIEHSPTLTKQSRRYRRSHSSKLCDQRSRNAIIAPLGKAHLPLEIVALADLPVTRPASAFDQPEAVGSADAIPA